jgi:hypothetical protein
LEFPTQFDAGNGACGLGLACGRPGLHARRATSDAFRLCSVEITKLGRRRVKPSVEARILELRAKGDGILKIGKKLGIGTSVVQRVFKQEPSQT